MLSREQVEQIARLAHLRLSTEEVAQMRVQLSAILNYMEVLWEVEASEVPPRAPILPLEDVTRPDEVRPSLPPDEALANAPEEEDGLFCTPAVFS